MLKIQGLVKTFKSADAADGQVLAVNDVGFEVEEGQMFTLLGPSGCGKTTTLRCIAGLERPDSGLIKIQDRTLFSSQDAVWINANVRGLGMVFQSYAIWPHMNVFKNVAFPLEVSRRERGLSKADIRDQVERVLTVMQLQDLLDRPATDLSGGQQQRLALARALVLEPPVLLLDEPLSNLDAKLREEMRFELKRLQDDLGITAVYVTHDQSEALAMSNVIAVMDRGEIVQVGSPRQIYQEPSSRFVADFIGVSNFIDGDVVGRESDGNVVVDTAVGRLVVHDKSDTTPDGAISIVIRPEDLVLDRSENLQADNILEGRVQGRAFLGEAVDHVVAVGDLSVRVRANPSISIPAETDVRIGFDAAMASIIAR